MPSTCTNPQKPRRKRRTERLPILGGFGLPLTLAVGLGACGAPMDFDEETLETESTLIAEEEAARQRDFINDRCTTVNPGRELVIRALPVVNDRVRTRWTGSRTNPADGAWHFGKLMTNMAGKKNPSDFTRSLFAKWARPQRVNGQTIPARTEINRLLQAWPKLRNGKLDLTKAPLRLLSIVNRMDLRKLSQGNAGEGRFVFGVLMPGSSGPVGPQSLTKVSELEPRHEPEPNNNFRQSPFTIILEYKLPANNRADVQRWARDWHGLGNLPPTSAAYRNKLQTITNRFTRRNAFPGKPNGSAIGQIRSNENALHPTWELREFRLNGRGQIVQSTVENTPANRWNETQTFATWTNRNQRNIRRGKHRVPLRFRINKRTVNFRGGAVTNEGADIWTASEIRDPVARHKLSLNTCNGCHGGETNTFFLHIAPREQNQPAALSAFMTGVNVNDPVTGARRRFNEFARRSADLRRLICRPQTAPTEGTLQRVH